MVRTWRDSHRGNGDHTYCFFSIKEVHTVAPHIRNTSPSRINSGYIPLPSLSLNLGTWPLSSHADQPHLISVKADAR